MNFEDYVSSQFDIDLKDDELLIANQMNKIKPSKYKLMSDLLQNQQLPIAKNSRKQLKKVRLTRRSKNKIKNQLVAASLGSRIHFDQVSIFDTITNSSFGKITNNLVRFGTKNTKVQTPIPRRPSIEQTYKQQQINATLKTIKFMTKTQKIVPKSSKSNKSYKSQKSQKNVKLQNPNYLEMYTQKQFQDGTKFRGICQKGVLTKGELSFKNKFVYNGELFLDKFHGKGKLFLPTGQVIEADWIQGQPLGKVIIKYPQGQLYYGEVKKYRRHGDGHLFFADGSKYQGAFIDGEVCGYGQFTSANGEKTIGYWSIGQYLGPNDDDYQRELNGAISHKKKTKMTSIRHGRSQKIAQKSPFTIQ